MNYNNQLLKSQREGFRKRHKKEGRPPRDYSLLLLMLYFGFALLAFFILH